MSFENSFKEKCVLVTGAGRGIGRAVALKLDSLGARVWAVSKNPDNLATLKSESGGRIQTVVVDLADWAATREAIENISVVFDCLVNNAAICPAINFMDTTAQDFDRVCAVNLKAVMNVSQIVARKMIDAKRPGSIVNMTSIGGIKATPMVTAYSVLKAGLDQLTKIMAIELGPQKIRVNAVSPASVDTDIRRSFMVHVTEEMIADYEMRVPLRRGVVEMEEVVNSVLFYLSDLVSVVTGTILQLDGALSLV